MASSSKAAGTAALLLLLLLTAAIAAPAEASKKNVALDSMPLAPKMQPAAEDVVAAKNIGWRNSVPGQKMRPAAEEDVAAPSTCVGSLLALSPCLPFFRDGGTESAPEGCCEGLQGIVDDDQEVCLCHVVNHTLERAIGVGIPAGRALALIGGLCGISPPQGFLATCASRNNVPPLYACPAPSA